MIEPAQQSNPNSAAKKRRPAFVIGIALIILCVLFFSGLIPRIFNWEKLNEAAEVTPPILVSVQKLKADRKPVELILPSIIQAMHFTPIWARTNGYLVRFLVDIGDTVTEGQLLAVIDTPEIDEQLIQAKADLASAMARLEIARISSKRWNDLYQLNSKAVPYQEVDERNSTLHSAEADVNSFQANVQRLEQLQGFNQIYAPFYGTITERNIDVGSLITAGSNNNPQQLYQIAQMDVLRVFVDVPQYFFRLIKDGVEAQVKVQEFPGKTFKGSVVRTAGALNPIARTLHTQINVDNKDGLLMAGLYAEVIFSLVPDNAYFIIPTRALIIRNQAPQVAVLDKDNHVKLVNVSVGRDYGKTIEIVAGLKENDLVITNPSTRIVDGAVVQLQQ